VAGASAGFRDLASTKRDRCQEIRLRPRRGSAGSVRTEQGGGNAAGLFACHCRAGRTEPWPGEALSVNISSRQWLCYVVSSSLINLFWIRCLHMSFNRYLMKFLVVLCAIPNLFGTQRIWLSRLDFRYRFRDCFSTVVVVVFGYTVIMVESS